MNVQNLAEKAMKRIEGVSMCPGDCLCSRKIEITYKVKKKIIHLISVHDESFRFRTQDCYHNLHRSKLDAFYQEPSQVCTFCNYPLE